MKTGAIIEARMTSTRLPGKIMLPVVGKAALELLIERLRQCQEISEIIIATTVNHCDDVIVDLGKKAGVKTFRGSEHDVLERVYFAAKEFGIDTIVEITSDCSLVDPDLISESIRVFKEGRYDYVSNVIKRTYPRGLDVQTFKTSVLEDVHRTANDPVDREHVALHIYEHPEKYRLQNFSASPELSMPEQRLTLDTPEDYFVIRSVFEALYPVSKSFRYVDIYNFLKQNPQIAAINAGIHQKKARSYDFTAKARKHLRLD